jgi:hypothetical protein
MNNKEKVTFSEWMEDKLDSDFMCGILKGFTAAAAIVFGLLSLVFGIVAAFSGTPWILNAVMFVVFGLLTGVFAGIAWFLFEEY